MIKTDIKISSHGYEAYFRSDLGGNCYRLYHAPTQSELLRTPKDENELFDEIYLYIRVGTSDSAQTAIKYGEICQKVYPLMGFICSNNLVHKYDINVEPDFLAPKTESEFYCDVNITLRKIINSSIGMVVRLIFKVVLTFLKGAKKAKAPTEENTQTVNN